MDEQINTNPEIPAEVVMPSAEKGSTQETASISFRNQMSEEFGKLTRHRLPWGVAGVFAWLLLFSIGVLIPAEPSRINLGWNPQSDVETKSKKLEERITEIENKVNTPKSDKQAPPKSPDTGNTEKSKDAPSGNPTTGSASKELTGNANQVNPSAGDQPKTKPENQVKDEKPIAARIDTKECNKPSKFWSFVIATFTFTPLNVGILCVLAAFIGGCSINKNEISRIHQEILDLEANPPILPNPELARLRQRLDYLTEHPGYSTIRGLVVYLIIISGLFIIGAPLTGENGTQSITLSQYMKLAGLFSFFGYLSGYDPTVFSSVIGVGTRQLNSSKPAQ